MSQWLLISYGGSTAGQNETKYVGPYGNHDSSVTTEANAQAKVRGTYHSTNAWSLLQVNVTSAAGTSTFANRINGSDGSMSVSITATGLIEDVTNNDALSEGDLICFRLTGGDMHNDTASIRTVGSLLDDNGNDVCLIGGQGGFGSTRTNVRYQAAVGESIFLTTTEAEAQTKFYQATTLRHFRMYVPINGTGVTTTAIVRIDGVDGNQTLSISGTGDFEDNTNNDVISSGEKVSVEWDCSAASSGTTNCTSFGFESSATAHVFGLHQSSAGAANGVTVYWGMGGSALTNLTESEAQIEANVAEVLGHLQAYCNTYSSNAAGTLDLRADGASESPSISVNGTGFFENTADEYTTAATDDINFRFDNTTASSGSTLFSTTSIYQGTVSAGGATPVPTPATGKYTALVPAAIRGAIFTVPAPATGAYKALTPVAVQLLAATPDPATGKYTALAPEAVKGALATVPPPATGAYTAVAPAVVNGAVALTPPPATGVYQAVVPVAARSLAVVPPPATGSWAAVTPAAVLSLATVPPPAAGAWKALVPQVVTAGETVTTPAPATGTWQAVVPVAARSLATVPAPATGSWTALTPAVALGTASTTPAPAIAVYEAVTPVAARLNAIVPAPATGAWAAVTPATVHGAVATTPAPATGAWKALVPQVPSGVRIATPAPASGSLSAVTPEAVRGALAVVPPLATGTWEAVAPAAARFLATVPPPATGTYTALAPAAIRGALAVTPPPAAAAWKALTPEVPSAGRIEIPAPATGAYKALTPEAVRGALALTPAPATGAWKAITPATALSKAEIPAPATGSWEAVVPAAVLGASVQTPASASGRWLALTPFVPSAAAAQVPAPATGRFIALVPEAVKGAVAASPAPAAAVWESVPPEAVRSLALTTGPASGVWGAVVPAAARSYSTTPAPATGSYTSLAPDVSLTFVLAPTPAAASFTTLTPAVTLGVSTQTPAPASGQWLALVPEVIGAIVWTAVDSFKFVAANWEYTTFRLRVRMRSTSGTVFARVYDETDLHTEVQISTAAGTLTYLESALATLTDGNEYTVQIGSNSGSEARWIKEKVWMDS